MSETSTQPTATRGLRKTRVGRVISTSMDKTIVVQVVDRVPHPKFRKIVKKSKKFHAHDEKQEAIVGDFVKIAETRPISKTKCWRLVEVQTHNKLAVLLEADKEAEVPAEAEVAETV